MKVKFTVQLGDSEVNEILDIDEKLIMGECSQPGIKMQQLLYDWVDKQVSSCYQILDDRFKDEQHNMPYVDWMTKKRLGWK